MKLSALPQVTPTADTQVVTADGGGALAPISALASTISSLSGGVDVEFLLNDDGGYTWRTLDYYSQYGVYIDQISPSHKDYMPLIGVVFKHDSHYFGMSIYDPKEHTTLYNSIYKHLQITTDLDLDKPYY